MIFVDELRKWPHAKHRCFTDGSAHLTCDGHLIELHDFAAGIGLRRKWFQDHPFHPHYDLTAENRGRALKAGALFVRLKNRLEYGSEREECGMGHRP
jgi:hypothetical protein